MKKRILALLMTTVLLVGIFAAFSASAQTEDPFSVYTDGKISFASYNEGADAAFDGNNQTGFVGTVIGFHTKDIITLSYGETGSSFEGLNFSDLT